MNIGDSPLTARKFNFTQKELIVEGMADAKKILGWCKRDNLLTEEEERMLDTLFDNVKSGMGQQVKNAEAEHGEHVSFLADNAIYGPIYKSGAALYRMLQTVKLVRSYPGDSNSCSIMETILLSKKGSLIPYLKSGLWGYFGKALFVMPDEITKLIEGTEYGDAVFSEIARREKLWEDKNEVV